MNDSERSGKLRSSFALNAAQGWRKTKEKTLVVCSSRTRDIRATELLHKERDGNSKNGIGCPGASTQVCDQPGYKWRMDTVGPGFWENTKKKASLVRLEFTQWPCRSH